MILYKIFINRDGIPGGQFFGLGPGIGFHAQALNIGLKRAVAEQGMRKLVQKQKLSLRLVGA